MCVISGPVFSVSGTKIFAMPSQNGKRQLLVYRNAVNTPAENVMCLPVPNVRSLKFEKVYDTLFDDCESSFSRGRGDDVEYSVVPQGFLPIMEHGAYRVVVVPTMNDLERIPVEHARLTDGVKDFLRKNYTKHGWGVLLCKLKPGNSDYTPFAYSHDLLDSGNLFIPTMHYHDLSSSLKGHEFGMDNTFSAWDENMIKPHKDVHNADWDHDIYTCQTPKNAHTLFHVAPLRSNKINWSKMPSEYAIGTEIPLRCLQRKGNTYKNEDIILPTTLAPVAAPVAAVALAAPVAEPNLTTRVTQFLQSLLNVL